MAETSIVHIQSLTHRYGSRVALDTVSLDVERASIFGLLGPNGGGKTTLFKILTTLITPASGSASINGADVVTQCDEIRNHIGVVFQNPGLDDKLSVMENLIHQGHLYGMRGESLRTRAGELLERFGVSERACDRVETLSGGLKRRVELAKGLLHRPQLFILDEPSTGLDPAARCGLMDYLVELRDQDGVTSLLTTHLMDEADRCDRIGILDQGKLVAIDTPASLKEKIGGDVLTVCTSNPSEFSEKVTARFGGTVDVIDGVVRIERENGHSFVPDLIESFPGEIDSITLGKPTLDDVFVHLTGHRLGDDVTQY